MKNLKSSIFATVIACSAFLALVSTVSSPAQAADESKGAQRLMQPRNFNQEAAKPNDAIAMACSKCKTVYMTRANSSAKGAESLVAMGKPTLAVPVHACPTCGTTMQVIGHGKAKETKMAHQCGSCGVEMPSCCATKKAGHEAH